MVVKQETLTSAGGINVEGIASPVARASSELKTAIQADLHGDLNGGDEHSKDAEANWITMTELRQLLNEYRQAQKNKKPIVIGPWEWVYNSPTDLYETCLKDYITRVKLVTSYKQAQQDGDEEMITEITQIYEEIFSLSSGIKFWDTLPDRKETLKGLRPSGERLRPEVKQKIDAKFKILDF